MAVLATVTIGSVLGTVLIIAIVIGCLVVAVFGIFDRDLGLIAGAVGVLVVSVALWWWAMAFTFSGDYHAWNSRSGEVEKISKRLVSDGDKGMRERFVVVLNGQPYGIDDTRAALLKVGDQVNLKCKKDYEWGVPRTAHGWACRWNGGPAT